MDVTLALPLRLGSGLNAREHWRARARRVRAERDAVALYLAREKRPALPVRVELVRVAPSNGLDSDNLQGSLKACRDQVADWLGTDDRDPRIAWVYAQERGAWGVRITISTVEGR